MTGPQEPEPELGPIEWLDGDPADPTGPAGPGRSRQPARVPRLAWYALIGVLIVAVIAVLAVTRGRSAHRAAPTSEPATPSSRPTPAPTTSPPRGAPSGSPAPVTVRNLGRPLLDVPRGVELFARSGDTALRIELATGRITRTTGVELSSGGSTSMVATRHGLLMMASDPGVGVPGAGFRVPDGQPARPLPQRLTRNGGTLLPGPDPDHVWLVTSSGGSARTELVSPDGRPTGVTIPADGTADGAGNVIASLTGGVYLARGGAPLQRITAGALVATGPTRWLTEECDAHHRCTLDAVDRATGTHHSLRPVVDRYDPPGLISPDGRVAAITHLDRDELSATLQFIDTTTGASRNSVRLAVSNNIGGNQFVWTPDSRYLLAIDHQGRVVAIDRTGRVRVLVEGEIAASQLALRGP